MLVDYESPKPLRSNVKADRARRKDVQEQEHTQANEAKHNHFDFSLPQSHLHSMTPLPNRAVVRLVRWRPAGPGRDGFPELGKSMRSSKPLAFAGLRSREPAFEQVTGYPSRPRR
jgi:hypothetical protein